ncbi:helix-turn-helix domain-containing protein [Roseomonas sp. CCTCC AB2023176]|uniref:helix-turn-helix domain-containing protein n=1 Tax=Roseomonas sp. CCTCC AB2023176 TaxID=3342640 RepID=UPI0035D8136A
MARAGPDPTLAEVYGRGHYAPFTRGLRLAGSAPLALVRFAQPGGEFPDPPTTDFTLAVSERGSGRMRFDIGTGRRERPFRRGDLVLKPPGVATFFANDAPHGKSFISLPAAFVAARAAAAGLPTPSAGGVAFGRLHDDAFRSALLTRLLDLLWSDAGDEGPHGRLFADGVILALLATLARLAAPEAPRDAVASLPPARLRAVRDFVAAHLGESFGLDEMAAAAGLSPWHFARAFKVATGQTPRAYVAGLRVERARELLAEAALPLAQVAQDCGFADQAHFTTAFSRATGLTPGAYRRALRE